MAFETSEYNEIPETGDYVFHSLRNSEASQNFKVLAFDRIIMRFGSLLSCHCFWLNSELSCERIF